jgi:3-oxoacyl-[acyl-carrier protein] reductase
MTAPEYVPGHGLLAGRTVLITAAAGSGIGGATARKCLEEGAPCRHLRQARAPSGRNGCRARRARHPVRRDQARTTCSALFAGAIEPNWVASTCSSTTPASAGRSESLEMTDDQWSLVLDVTLNGHDALHARRAAPHVRARQRSDREQRLGARLAGPGGAGALRGGEGGRHGPHALCRHRGSAARRADQCGVAVAGDARRSWPRSPATSCSPSSTSREAFGRDAEPWEIANVIVFLASDYSSYMAGEVLSVSSQHP